MKELQFSNRILDAAEYQKPGADGKLPDFADIIDRKNRKWLVYDPAPNSANTWSISELGDFVRIPLVPQLSNNCDPVTALGYAWQIGFRAAHELLTGGVSFDAMHLSLGTPIEQLRDPNNNYPMHFRFWIGFAVRLET